MYALSKEFGKEAERDVADGKRRWNQIEMLPGVQTNKLGMKSTFRAWVDAGPFEHIRGFKVLCSEEKLNTLIREYTNALVYLFTRNIWLDHEHRTFLSTIMDFTKRDDDMYNNTTLREWAKSLRERLESASQNVPALKGKLATLKEERDRLLRELAALKEERARLMGELAALKK